MRQFTHGGSHHLLGQFELGYGIWLIGRELDAPVVGFPATIAGWNAAVVEFQRLEPYGYPLSPQPALPNTPVRASYAGTAGHLPQVQQANGMATSGGVLGISGAILSLIPIIGIVIGLIMGLLAIIFSGVGLSRAATFGSGKGLAITGLVLGILTVIFKLIPGIDVL